MWYEIRPAVPGDGFALFFTNDSTFRTQAGIYLEDLFVVEELSFEAGQAKASA